MPFLPPGGYPDVLTPFIEDIIFSTEIPVLINSYIYEIPIYI